MRRRGVAVWCVCWLVFAGAWFPSRDVYAVTLPTRQVNGVYVYAPSAGSVIVNAIGAALSRLNPWVGAVTLGMEIGRMVVQTSDGEIALTTAGKAILDAELNPIHTNPGQSYEGPKWTPSYGTNPLRWYDTTTAMANAECGHAPVSIETQNADRVYVNCGGGNAWVAYRAFRCLVPTAGPVRIYDFGDNPATCTPAPQQNASGGSRLWHPKNMANPANGGAEEAGWEAPTDPAVANPNNVTPVDTLQATPQAAGQANPQMTFTPHTDGGYSFQTWTPEYSNPSQPTTQTGWTVQTVTVNNGGTVTNVSIVHNNQSGPPNGPRPIVSDGTNTQNPNPNPQNPNPTPPQELNCDPISCESTQIQVRNELRGDGAPTMPDQAARITQAQTEQAGKLTQIPGEISAGQSADQSVWFSWVWTAPTGSCTPFTGSVHGFAVSWDLCPTINNIRDVIGWMFALFGAWEVYNLIFRRPD